jgi:hypothetical protein
VQRIKTQQQKTRTKDGLDGGVAPALDLREHLAVRFVPLERHQIPLDIVPV